MTTLAGYYDRRHIKDRMDFYQRLLTFKPRSDLLDKKNLDIEQIQQNFFPEDEGEPMNTPPRILPPEEPDDDEKLAEPDPEDPRAGQSRKDVECERDAAWEFGIQHARDSKKKDAMIAERNAIIRNLRTQLQHARRTAMPPSHKSVAPSPPDQSPSVRAPGSEFLGGSTASDQPVSSETFSGTSVIPDDPMIEDVPSDPESLEVSIPPTGKYRTTTKSELKKRDAERAKRKKKPKT